MLRFFLLFLLVISSCTEKKSPHVQNEKKTIFASAKEAYIKKNYTHSLKLFSQIKTQLVGTTKLEAQLGEIASLISLGKDISVEIENWDIDRQYYWGGRSFDPSETISLNNIEQFNQKKISYKKLHVLDFLLETGNDDAIKILIKQKKNYLLNEFVLARAWFSLKQNLYAESQHLFSLVNDSNQNSSCILGLLLIDVLRGQDEIPEAIVQSFVLKDCYSLDQEQIVLSKKKLNNITSETLIADMIFHLGVSTKHAFPILERGIQFVTQNKEKISESTDYLELFSLAQGWLVFSKGNLNNAKKIFEVIVAKKNSTPRYFEAHLGLAIIYWMEEEDCEELRKHFFWLKNNVYWLGGRKISLFSKKRSHANWQKSIDENRKNRENLVLLDALCRLGEGRSAHAFLGYLVDEFENQKTLLLYEEEEKNIPKDVYAENKIWEKID